MPREVDVNKFRYGDFSQEDLRLFATEIGTLKAELESQIDVMKRHRLKTIHTDGFKKIPHGIGIIKHGINNIKKALTPLTWGTK